MILQLKGLGNLFKKVYEKRNFLALMSHFEYPDYFYDIQEHLYKTLTNSRIVTVIFPVNFFQKVNNPL